MNKSAIRMVKKMAHCPCCGEASKRHSNGKRTLHDLNHKTYLVEYSKHYCMRCRKFFSLQVPGARGSHRYMDRVMVEVVKLLLIKNLTLDAVMEKMQREHGLDIPRSTMHEWVTINWILEKIGVDL